MFGGSLQLLPTRQLSPPIKAVLLWRSKPLYATLNPLDGNHYLSSTSARSVIYQHQSSCLLRTCSRPTYEPAQLFATMRLDSRYIHSPGGTTNSVVEILKDIGELNTRVSAQNSKTEKQNIIAGYPWLRELLE